jgi:hypothetical protein
VAVGIRQLGPQRWELRLLVGAGAPDVFGYLLAFERHPEWEHELQAVRATGGRPGTVGAVYVKTYGARPAGGLLGRLVGPAPIRATCTITAVEPPTRLAWKQHLSHRAAGPSSFQHVDVAVLPQAAGCELVVTRELVGMEGAGADVSAGLAARFAGLGLAGAMPPDVVARQTLDGHPSRGPGPTSLDRLQAILSS